MTYGKRGDNWTYLFGVLGAVTVLNALWMLAAPVHWWQELPAGVPDFGPLNEHFVRDIGSTFLTLGAALLWGAFVPSVRRAALVFVTMWNVAHSVVHVVDTARGLVGPEHWGVDFPLVYAPTIGLAVLTVVLVRQERRAAA